MPPPQRPGVNMGRKSRLGKSKFAPPMQEQSDGDDLASPSHGNAKKSYAEDAISVNLEQRSYEFELRSQLGRFRVA